MRGVSSLDITIDNDDDDIAFLRDKYETAKLRAIEMNAIIEVPIPLRVHIEQASKVYSGITTITTITTTTTTTTTTFTTITTNINTPTTIVAVSALLYATIGVVKVNSLDLYIRKKGAQLPKNLFGLYDWQKVLDIARRVRESAINPNLDDNVKFESSLIGSDGNSIVKFSIGNSLYSGIIITTIINAITTITTTIIVIITTTITTTINNNTTTRHRYINGIREDPNERHTHADAAETRTTH